MYKCDNCGHLFFKPGAYVEHHGDQSAPGEQIDCCPVCHCGYSKFVETDIVSGVLKFSELKPADALLVEDILQQRFNALDGASDCFILPYATMYAEDEELNFEEYVIRTVLSRRSIPDSWRPLIANVVNLGISVCRQLTETDKQLCATIDPLYDCKPRFISDSVECCAKAMSTAKYVTICIGSVAYKVNPKLILGGSNEG